MPGSTHRNGGSWIMLTLAVLGAVPSVYGSAPEAHNTTWNRPRRIGADWAPKRRIGLPNPFGMGLFLATMSRDIEVYDVRVTVPGIEPTSISNVASFDERNHTTLAALKQHR
jgi:hypothetical protein